MTDKETINENVVNNCGSLIPSNDGTDPFYCPHRAIISIESSVSGHYNHYCQRHAMKRILDLISQIHPLNEEMVKLMDGLSYANRQYPFIIPT